MNFVEPGLFCRGLGHSDSTDLGSTVLTAIFLLYSFDHHRHGVVLVLVYTGYSICEVFGNLGKPLALLAVLVHVIQHKTFHAHPVSLQNLPFFGNGEPSLMFQMITIWGIVANILKLSFLVA